MELPGTKRFSNISALIQVVLVELSDAVVEFEHPNIGLEKVCPTYPQM